MKKLLFAGCFFALLFPATTVFAADTTVVKSPDQRISFKLFSRENNLCFEILSGNTYVITCSPLLMSLDNIPVTGDVIVGKPEKYTINETYPWREAHATAVNHCNGIRIPVSTKNKLAYTIEVKVFNDGAAFRVIIPGSATTSRIPDEATVFTIPSTATVWYHDMDMHYESVHVKRAAGEIKEGEWLAPPATFKVQQGLYAAITEADLKDYSGMSLQATGKSGMMIRLAQHQPTSYPYKLRYSPEDTFRLAQPAAVKGRITTPWRVVLIGDLNTMVNNDIVHNLCPPPDNKIFPAGINTDWVKPGRAVWKYLNGGGDGTVEVMKKFTDGAAALGFEYNILEGFWSRWSDEQIKDLVTYSKNKGVGIWVWKHSKSLRSDTARIAFFKRCHDLGITGAKIDFFDHEAKEVIDLYTSILQEAAQYKILLDFHGAGKPTGLSRTWPNEMMREAVKGMESSKLLDRATHETTIPFTRYLAGPAEYTVVLFNDRRKNTTWAHQVASAAILNGPMLTYAANPDTILANPTVELIKDIPATWDETIVLPPSEIGELAVYARRKGDRWFLAIMNGVQSTKIKVPLYFLKDSYKALIAKDDPANPAAVIMQQATYSGKDILEIDLVSGGGFIAEFSK